MSVIAELPLFLILVLHTMQIKNHQIQVVGICMSSLSLVLNIVGLSIPYWYYYVDNGAHVNGGLWMECFSGVIFNAGIPHETPAFSMICKSVPTEGKCFKHRILNVCIYPQF